MRFGRFIDTWHNSSCIGIRPCRLENIHTQFEVSYRNTISGRTRKQYGFMPTQYRGQKFQFFNNTLTHTHFLVTYTKFHFHNNKLCLMHVSTSFHTWLIPRTLKTEAACSSEKPLITNGLLDVIFQKIEFFNIVTLTKWKSRTTHYQPACHRENLRDNFKITRLHNIISNDIWWQMCLDNFCNSSECRKAMSD
jgi:hypothetical protein